MTLDLLKNDCKKKKKMKYWYRGQLFEILIELYRHDMHEIYSDTISSILQLTIFPPKTALKNINALYFQSTKLFCILIKINIQQFNSYHLQVTNNQTPCVGKLALFSRKK